MNDAIADLVHITPVDLEKAFVLFSTYHDKAWSFVDCTSLAVMQRLGIGDAIALDRHFSQMPGVRVQP